MSTPEEIARQEAAAAVAPAPPATDEPKPAEDAPAPQDKAPEDAPKPAEDPKPASEPAPEPLSEGAQARIQKLIAEREDARREAAYLRGLSEGRQPKPESAPATPAMMIEDFLPTEQEFAAVGLTAENFEKMGRSYDDLLMAKSAFAMQKRTAVLAKKAEEARAKEAVAKSQSAFMERITKAAETDPDLPRIVDARPGDPYFVPISEAMAEVIRDSEVGPKLLRHFANNKADAQRIYTLPPMAAARELGRIEAKIMATPAPTPPRRVSQAPEPVASLTPAGVTEIDLDKVPIDDFMKKRNAQQYSAQGR